MKLTRCIYDQLEAAIRRFPGRKRTPKELHDFIVDWWEQEEACHYHIGCPDFTDRPALLYAVCGLRELCGVNRRTALLFLRMAVADLEARHPNPTDVRRYIARGTVTGRTGRGVKRTVPVDKKPKDSTIPTKDTSESDRILQRLKEKQ